MGTTSSSEVRTTPTTTTTHSQDRVNVTSSAQHQPRMSYLPPSRPPDVSPHTFDDDSWILSSEEPPSEVVFDHKTKLQPSSPPLQLSPQSASADSARTSPTTVTAQSQHKASVEITSSTDHPTRTSYLPPSRPLDVMPQQELMPSSKEVPSEACAVETNLQSSSQPLQPTPQGTDVDGTGVLGKSAGPLVQRKVLESESISAQSDEEVHEDGDRSNQEHFVSSPSRIQAQPDCPICLYVLQEPHVVTCCGQSFCRVCIERVKTKKLSCPMCQQLEFTHIPNRGLQRTLEDTEVCCPHKEAGCQWVGKMGSLRQHLNESGELIPDACRFAPRECSQCHKQIQRQMFESHQRESCIKRPFECEYCGEYKSAYEDVVNKHWPVCKCYPVPCPNGCGVSPERRHLESHVDEDCPLTTVSCEFYHAGCDVELLREDMPAHMNENCVKHMSLLAGMTQRQQECVTELTNKLEQGQKMLDDIRSENEKLKSELQRTTQESETLRAEKAEVTEKQKAARPHQDIADLREEIFTTLKKEKQNLEQKREEKVAMLEAGAEQLRQQISALKVASKHSTVDILRRESVLKEETEKMKQVVKELRLEAASKRQAEHKTDELRQVKEELREMKQKFDELKKKEKEAGILRYEVSQIKQKQEESMIERETLRQESDGIKKETMELAQHNKTRISHIEMKQEQNKFSIELTMPNFNKHKKANARWSSHPFYTNPHRYKLCLDVYANGFGDCKGTHVSVYARLLPGEFDDHLEWPFQGDIVVQLLNQLDEDKHPHETAISFSSENGDEILSTVASRVTTAEQSRSGWGYDDFISQDALGYSQAEVCQYLRDDCLTFRVMRARPLDLIQEITTLKENVEQLQREKRLACELQPYSSLLVDYVDSKGKTISWQDIGIMIDVSPGSTSEDNPVVRVQAQCFLPGPGLSVILPENVQLASPVYRISATPHFSKKVELSIAHFATLDSKDEMTFLHSSDRSPPYHFQPVPGGTFIQHGTCGSLWLSKFCKITTGRRKRSASERGEGTPKSAKRREGICVSFAICFLDLAHCIVTTGTTCPMLKHTPFLK